jgi:hypothetical protein
MQVGTDPRPSAPPEWLLELSMRLACPCPQGLHGIMVCSSAGPQGLHGIMVCSPAGPQGLHGMGSRVSRPDGAMPSIALTPAGGATQSGTMCCCVDPASSCCICSAKAAIHTGQGRHPHGPRPPSTRAKAAIHTGQGRHPNGIPWDRICSAAPSTFHARDSAPAWAARASKAHVRWHFACSSSCV